MGVEKKTWKLEVNRIVSIWLSLGIASYSLDVECSSWKRRVCFYEECSFWFVD